MSKYPGEHMFSAQAASKGKHCGEVTPEPYGDQESTSLEEVRWYSSKYKIALMGSLVMAGLVYAQSSPAPFKSTSPEAHDSSLPSLPHYNLDPNIANNIGLYSTRYTVPSEISPEVPKGCNVTMINILQRHGARFATTRQLPAIEAILAKLKTVQNITDPSLQFVPGFTYTYPVNQLTLFGRNQSILYIWPNNCEKIRQSSTAQFVRTPHVDRIVESARWWQQGFSGGAFDVAVSSLPQPDVSIPIGNNSNNTLNVQTCVAAEALSPPPGKIASAKWLPTYAAPITQRLNRLLPGAELTDKDTAGLMSLCGADTVAKNGAPSPWCHVFTKDEWEGHEYYRDLDQYYSSSYGSAYARSQGAGWINELLSRLTGTPVQDNTTTNRTLNANMTTFPFGPSAPSIFADFSNDINMAMVLSAMGILRDKVDLPLVGPIPSTRHFVLSKIIPFAGLTVVEKILCSTANSALSAGDYVRVIINDAVIPLDFPACGNLGSKHGICPLDGFVESQAYSRAGGNFTSCFTSNNSTSENA